jgi:hypothetical protein
LLLMELYVHQDSPLAATQELRPCPLVRRSSSPLLPIFATTTSPSTANASTPSSCG